LQIADGHYYQQDTGSPAYNVSNVNLWMGGPAAKECIYVSDSDRDSDFGIEHTPPSSPTLSIGAMSPPMTPITELCDELVTEANNINGYPAPASAHAADLETGEQPQPQPQPQPQEPPSIQMCDILNDPENNRDSSAYLFQSQQQLQPAAAPTNMHVEAVDASICPSANLYADADANSGPAATQQQEPQMQSDYEDGMYRHQEGMQQDMHQAMHQAMLQPISIEEMVAEANCYHSPTLEERQAAAAVWAVMINDIYEWGKLMCDAGLTPNTENIGKFILQFSRGKKICIRCHKLFGNAKRTPRCRCEE
jgi:hypothetical protein